MTLEAFFLTVGSNVVNAIIQQAITKAGNRSDKRYIEQVIDDYLRSHPQVGQPSVIEREIIVILANGGLVAPSGQLRLPSSRELSVLPDKLLGAWWDSRVYKIVSVLSEKVLDVEGKSSYDGVRIQQWDYYGTANQHWKLIPIGGNRNLFKIHSLQSAKVLDVTDWRTDNGVRIQQWRYEGQANQQWQLIPIDSHGEIFKIISAHSGKALDVRDKSTDNGAKIQQWDYWGGTNQQWRLMHIN